MRTASSWMILSLLIACGDPVDRGLDCVDPAGAGAGDVACVTVPYSVVDHADIASEDGAVTLLSGRVAVERVSLYDGDREVVWIRDQVFDLGGDGGYVLVQAPLPPGAYSRMEIVLASTSPETPTFDGEIQRDGDPPLGVLYDARLVGERFVDPPLVITEETGDAVELPISLLTLFFYTWPYSRSTDGVIHFAGVEQAREAFEGNLLNLWHPRSMP